MQLDNKFLALKTQLANFRPRERVNFGEVLKDYKAAMGDGQLQCDAFMVLSTTTLPSIIVKLYSIITKTDIHSKLQPLFKCIHY